MMRAVMEGAGLTFWPVLSLVVFTLFGAGLLAWLYRSGSKDFYRRMAHIATDGRDVGSEG